MVAVGMAFMLLWEPVIYHTPIWDTGDDLWGVFRAAHFVGWGYIGGVYTPINGVLSFPGLPVLLAPVAMLTGALHLSESAPLIYIPHPGAALILQPIEMLLVSTVVFASDALAERMFVSTRRRIVLCVVAAVLAWPIAAVWGHAEDALCMTFALYSMVAMLDRKWSKCAWLLGFGIVVQPLVALALPLFVAASPSGKRLACATKSMALSVVLVGVAFVGDPRDTDQSLVKQPTQPAVNHATPWLALAPRMSAGAIQPIVGRSTRVIHSLYFVAGGPGRTIDIVVALLAGGFVWRRSQDPVQLMWLAAVVLASRCFFEAVMTPYYLAPPLFLALVLASHQSGKRFWAASALALEVTVFAYHHLNPWVWWPTTVLGLSVILVLARPSHAELQPEQVGAPAVDASARDSDDPNPECVQVPDSESSLKPALL
jgi:hypothetical protein